MEIDRGIIFKALRGKATPQEEDLLDRWSQEYPEEFRNASAECHSLLDLAELSEAASGGITRVEKDVDAARKSQGKIFRRVFGAVAGVAAAVALVAGGMFVSQRLYQESLSKQLVCVEAPKGERLKITLPDGTSVFLNSGAKLEYPVLFSPDDRQVHLCGEAMFSVVHDESKPFRVNTFASTIEVLGTEFNVVADKEAGYFETVLVSGRVRLTNIQGKGRGEVEMKPNEKISMKEGRLLLERLDSPQDELCWTQGMILIDGSDFTELMRTFANSFDVNIKIDTQTLPDISMVRGKIRMSDGVENALRIIQHTADFNFKMDVETNTVTIY